MITRRRTVVVALGIGQTLSWGSSFYLPAILATQMARDLAVSAPTVFAAFSAALMVSAAVGPAAGRAIDRYGGRRVLMFANLVFACGLIALGSVRGVGSLFAAWAVIGIAMGSGLYDAAFATLVRLYRHDARDAITGITLIAGLASTIAWPLSTFLDAQIGWRGACFTWAALHIVLGLPLNASVPEAVQEPAAAAFLEVQMPYTTVASDARPAMRVGALSAALLSYVFAVVWFIATAMASHLPRMLEATGASVVVAVGVSTLVGPAQVAGRLLEFGFMRHVSSLLSARLAALAHPLGALLLMTLGAPLAAAFALLHGVGNGILTIAKGTLPLLMFGPAGYGARQGWLMLPARVAQAIAPLAFGVALDRLGGQAVWLSGALGFSAFVALLLVPAPRATSTLHAQHGVE